MHRKSGVKRCGDSMPFLRCTILQVLPHVQLSRNILDPDFWVFTEVLLCWHDWWNYWLLSCSPVVEEWDSSHALVFLWPAPILKLPRVGQPPVIILVYKRCSYYCRNSKVFRRSFLSKKSESQIYSTILQIGVKFCHIIFIFWRSCRFLKMCCVVNYIV